MGRAIFQGAIPDAMHPVARQPFLGARVQADDGAALRTHEIIHGDAKGVADPAGLTDDLVHGQFLVRIRPSDLRHRLHLCHRSEAFHADRRRLQAEIAVQSVNNGRKIVLIIVVEAIGGGHGCSPKSVAALYSGLVWR